MTARQKLDANELKPVLLAMAGNQCVVCGKHISPSDVWDLAHRVLKSRSMIEKYGREVIFHPLNMVPACHGTKAGKSCNDRCNLAGQRAQAHELLDRIIRVTTGMEPEPDMRAEYELLREEFAGRYNA